MKAPLALVLASLLLGCASQGPATRKAAILPAEAVISDNRSSDQRASKRDSNFSAISFLGDERLAQPAAELLADALVSQSAGGTSRPMKIEIEQLRVVDFFPVRLGAGGQGWLGPMIFKSLIDGNTDWSFVDAAGVQRGQDSIICVFVGRINGVRVRSAASEPYRISPFALLVVSDPDFQRAVNAAVRRAALQALSQAAG